MIRLKNKVEELTTFLKFLLKNKTIILVLIFMMGCSTFVLEQPEAEVMTREDSVLMIASELNIEFDRSDSINIHGILDQIIVEQKRLLVELDSIDIRMAKVETEAVTYKKKEAEELRLKLLAEAEAIKQELQRINSVTKSFTNLDPKKLDTASIQPPQIKIKEEEVDHQKTDSYTTLQPGNYITRIDSAHVMSIYVDPELNIFFSKPRFDTVTVIRPAGIPMNPRMKKELDDIKNKMSNN